MAYEIKIARALGKAEIGVYAASAGAMIDILPLSTVAALTSTQLAELLDALWAGCQESKRIAAREAVAGGAIWDERRQAYRDIV